MLQQLIISQTRPLLLKRGVTEVDFSPEYLAYLDEQMDKDLEEAYNEWFENQPEHIQEEIRTGINRVKVELNTQLQSGTLHQLVLNQKGLMKMEV